MVSRRSLASASLFAVALFTSPAPAQVLPNNIAARVFGARPSAFAADLSPDGDKVVYIASANGTGNLVRVLDLKTKQTADVIASSGKPDSINWCEFASEDWIVCHVRGDIPFYTSIVGVSKLVAINLATHETKNLGTLENETDATVHQNDGYVIGYPAGSSPTVIMARNYVLSVQNGAMNSLAPPVSVGVDKIDLARLKVTHIEAANPLVENLLTEGDGTPRVMERAQYDGTGRLTGISIYRYRPRGSTNWVDLTTYDSKNDTGTIPLAVDGPTNQVYLLRKRDGRQVLFRQALQPNSPLVEVASNPNYDIDGVVRLRRDGPVVGYSYTDDRAETVYFDPQYASLLSDLRKALPDDPLIELSGLSRDGNKVLIHVAGDQDPGAYFVFDRTTRTLDFAVENQESLAKVPLAPMKLVSVPTSDGKTIPAYLTVPASHAANGPAIVLPHGGPSSRDSFGFDWLVQFFAARGYAVIQPNYRGSAGFGDQFLGDNAFKDWKTAISDISSSADYLVKQGIADDKKLAILGWSYGGYAALQSAVVSPTKYKAVVAIAPVTDLSHLGKDSEDFTNANLVKDFIGKGPNLSEGSPLHHASAIKAPVLLVHGDLDSNVRIQHSERMEKALLAAGDQVELLEFKGLNHQLDDGDARARMLAKAGELLDRTIGH